MITGVNNNMLPDARKPKCYYLFRVQKRLGKGLFIAKGFPKMIITHGSFRAISNKAYTGNIPRTRNCLYNIGLSGPILGPGHKLLHDEKQRRKQTQEKKSLPLASR